MLRFMQYSTLLFIMIALLPSTQAQVSFDLGTRAGFSFNGVNNGGQIDTSAQSVLFTPSIAFVAELGFGDKFFIQPEIGFTQKGWRLGQDDVLLGDNFYVERVNYRVLPVLLKFAVQNTEDQIATIYVGPSFNRITRAQEKIDFFGVEEEIDHDLEANDSPYNVSDIGFVVGVGAKAFFPKGGAFVADARFSTGTSPYKTISQDGADFGFNYWTLNLSFGIMFQTVKR